MSKYKVVMITASSIDEGERIAEALVGERLAACVNVLKNCRSIYRWEGQIVRDDEVMLIAKTLSTRFEALQERVHELHSYSVPEVIAFDLTRVAKGYEDFLDGVLERGK